MNQQLTCIYSATRRPKIPTTPAAPNVTAPVGAAPPADLVVEAADPADPVAVDDAPAVPVAVPVAVVPADEPAVVFAFAVPVALDPGSREPPEHTGTLDGTDVYVGV